MYPPLMQLTGWVGVARGGLGAQAGREGREGAGEERAAMVEAAGAGNQVALQIQPGATRVASGRRKPRRAEG